MGSALEETAAVSQEARPEGQQSAGWFFWTGLGGAFALFAFIQIGFWLISQHSTLLLIAGVLSFVAVAYLIFLGVRAILKELNQ